MNVKDMVELLYETKKERYYMLLNDYDIVDIDLYICKLEHNLEMMKSAGSE